MISRQTHSECYVYITLPRQTQSITAGRLVIEKNRQGNSTGQFVYGRTYLSNKDAVEIDPVELKIAPETFRNGRLNGVFSALRDAGPDFWGRRVIEKHSGKTDLSEIDYLLESPDDRAGALGFGLHQKPPAPLRKYNKTLDLSKLQLTAEKILREQLDESDNETIQAQELLLIGTSMGGARPKTVVEDDIGLWIAKFGRPDDRWNNQKVEHAMLELARSCGIQAARSRIEKVAGKDVLLVQRFDREKTSKGYIRARMISALTLLRAEEEVIRRDNWSYPLMVEELRRVVAAPKADAVELFRRMCFNALISNIDDHPRNHAFIAFDKAWRLSPAYDLTPSPSVSQRRDLALVCGAEGRLATARNLMSECNRFSLDEKEAQSIVDKMTKQVRSTWHSVVRSCGVSVRDAETIKSAFVYSGFDES